MQLMEGNGAGPTGRFDGRLGWRAIGKARRDVDTKRLDVVNMTGKAVRAWTDRQPDQ